MSLYTPVQFLGTIYQLEQSTLSTLSTRGISLHSYATRLEAFSALLKEDLEDVHRLNAYFTNVAYGDDQFDQKVQELEDTENEFRVNLKNFRNLHAQIDQMESTLRAIMISPGISDKDSATLSSFAKQIMNYADAQVKTVRACIDLLAATKNQLEGRG